MPAQLVPILAEVLVERAAPPLADEIRGVLATHTIAWADTGAALGRIVARRLELHAVLGARLPELPPAAMLAHLATALEPLVQRLAQRRLAARLPPS
jgi:hypothetical protein